MRERKDISDGDTAFWLRKRHPSGGQLRRRGQKGGKREGRKERHQSIPPLTGTDEGLIRHERHQYGGPGLAALGRC